MQNMEDKYCHVCGKELDRVEIEGFNSETGKRNIRLVCSSRKPHHRGINHVFVKSGGFSSWLISPLCECGVTERVHNELA